MARKKIIHDEDDEEQVPQNHQKYPSHTHKAQHPSAYHGAHGNASNPKKKQHGASDDSYDPLLKQLSNIGLTIKEMPGDGNCLFRALADQLEGHPRNHMHHRRAVVQYMRDNRADFEPFVEDDIPFEKHIQALSQPGTFAGNDAIVAFSRSHNVVVVIHQVNTPAWVIHPSKDDEKPQPFLNEVHIAYHNGDHYNSVRRIDDDSENPANIRTTYSQDMTGASGGSSDKSLLKRSPPRHSPHSLNKSSSYSYSAGSVGSAFDNGSVLYGNRDEDYWVTDHGDIDQIVQDLMDKCDYDDAKFVRETLIDYNFDMTSTVDVLLSMHAYLNGMEAKTKSSPTCDQKTKPSSINETVYLSNSTQESNTLVHDKKTEITTMDLGNSSSMTYESEVSSFKESEVSSQRTAPGNGDESDDSSEEMSTSVPEAAAAASHVTKTKQPTGRKKKEMKKRERKREADLRKKQQSGDTVNVNGEVENPVFVVPKLGTLNI